MILGGFSSEQADHDFGPSDADRPYELGTLRDLLGTDGRIEEVVTGLVRLREGPKHDGVAHVVRLPARAPAGAG